MRQNKAQGLTVLELLVVLAAIAVVVLITVPGSTLLMETYRIKKTYSDLFTSLELAKSEADRRSSAVVMCPSSNGHSCRDDADWNQGWLLFSDGNGNGTAQEIELIRAFEAPNTNIRIAAKGAVKAKAIITTTGLVEQNEVKSGLFIVCHRNSDTTPKVIQIMDDGWVEPVPVHSESC